MSEEQKTEKPKRKLSLNLKMSKWDKISIMITLVFVVLVVLPTLTPKDNCEVARPGYECASIKDVMIEHCQYWGEYDCDTSSNLKMACNEISASLICP
jgi:hypothetical protein